MSLTPKNMPQPLVDSLFGILRILFLLTGIFLIVWMLITGRIDIRGGKYPGAETMRNNPILRSEDPGRFWFAWGLFAFIFSVIMLVWFTQP